MHHRLPVLCLLALVALCGLTPSHTAEGLGLGNGQRDFVKMIPQTYGGVLVIKDWGKLVTIDDRSPMGKLVKNEAFKHSAFGFLAQMIPKPGDIEKAIGLDQEAALRLFKGQAVIGVKLVTGQGDLAIDNAENEPDPVGKRRVKFSLMPTVEVLSYIEFNGTPAEYEKTLRGIKQLAEDRGTLLDFASEPFEGALMTTFTIKENNEKEDTYYCALLDGVIVAGQTQDQLREGIKALRTEIITDNFAATPSYLKTTAEMGENDGYAIVNLDGMSAQLRKLVEDLMKKMNEEQPSSKLFIDPITVAKELNFESLNAAYGSFKYEEKQIVLNWGLTWKEKVGLASLIQYGPLPVELPDFVTTEFKAASVSSIDLSRTWDAIRTLGQKITPQGWIMMNTMIATQPEIEKALEGLREDLLLNLEPEIISLQGFPGRHPDDNTQPGLIYVLKIKRPEGVLKAIDAFKSILSVNLKLEEIEDPEERTYLGSTIYTYKNVPLLGFGAQVVVEDTDQETKTLEPKGGDLSYALVDDRLIIAAGQAGFIETVIANMKTPGRTLVGSGVFDDIDGISGIPSDLDYIDMATMLRATLNDMIEQAEFFDQSDVDAERLPSRLNKQELLKLRETLKDLHYHYASKSFMSETGFHTKALITEDKE